MRNILILFFFVVPLVSNSQRKVIFDTTRVNTTSKDFFEKNVVIDSILYNTYYGWSRILNVFLKSVWSDISYYTGSINKSEYFNYNFLGDKYRIAKKYGELQLPEKDMAVLISLSCDPNSSLKFTATKDSIRFILESYCPEKITDVDKKASLDTDYDRVFTSTEEGASFKNGIKLLQDKIQTSYDDAIWDTSIEQIDSVLIFKILVVRKDSCPKSIELVEGKYSRFAKLVMDELKVACSWIPAMQGGREVFSYKEIFIKLNKDKSITVGI